MIKNLCMKILILLSITVVLGGCGAPGDKDVGEADELTGAFAGPAGYLSFYPDGEVLVSLSDDHVWLLEGKENDQTYGYVLSWAMKKSPMIRPKLFISMTAVIPSRR